jgi:hypothetical protein
MRLPMEKYSDTPMDLAGGNFRFYGINGSTEFEVVS